MQGTHLASASGDMSVKLWSFAKQRCVANLKGHTQAVWGVAWHDQGTFLASCSMDQSLRIWDSATGKCRQILRCDMRSLACIMQAPLALGVHWRRHVDRLTESEQLYLVTCHAEAA